MTEIKVGENTYSDAQKLIEDFPELLVHRDQLTAIIAGNQPVPAELRTFEDVQSWLYGSQGWEQGGEKIYWSRMRDLAARLNSLPLTELAKLDVGALPGLFRDVLAVRLGVLKALDDHLRPLTAGIKTVEKFRAPLYVETGLLFADEIFDQMTKIIARLIPGKPAAKELPAPVMGATDVAEATVLWQAYANSQVLIFRDIAAAIDSVKASPEAISAMKKLEVVTPLITKNLLTGIAVLLHFAPTRRALADIAATTKAKSRLVLIGGSQETLAMLPGIAGREAPALWEKEGWHTGLVVGTEKDSTKLIPAGKFISDPSTLFGVSPLAPDIDQGKWKGYTLAAREIVLAHEINHIQRQLGGGWGGGFPKGTPPEIHSAFQKAEEYKAIAQGEQPLRALIGLQPRGHTSISIAIELKASKRVLSDFIKFFVS